MAVGVVLVAAGRGSRFGSRRPKQFLPLAGRPLFHWSLSVFERTPAVRRIVLVVPRSEIKGVSGTITRGRFRKVFEIIEGGVDRADSVRRGVRALPKEVDIVLVHDAARPLVTRKIVEDVIAAVRRSGAALAAWPVPDTLKKSRPLGGKKAIVGKTVSRERLWLAQTPQGLRRPLAERFLLNAARADTDDVQGMERAGLPVELVPGSPMNLKVTLPEDMEICETILRGRK